MRQSRCCAPVDGWEKSARAALTGQRRDSAFCRACLRFCVTCRGDQARLAVVRRRPVCVRRHWPIAVRPTNHMRTPARLPKRVGVLRSLVRGRCGRITRGRIIVVDDAFLAVLFAGIAGYRIARRRIVVVHDPLIGILFVAGRSGVLWTVIGASRSQMVNSKRGWRFLRNAVRRRTNRSRTLCRACVRFKSLKRELTAAPGFWE
jgi:hypothetical protein